MPFADYRPFPPVLQALRAGRMRPRSMNPLCVGTTQSRHDARQKNS